MVDKELEALVHLAAKAYSKPTTAELKAKAKALIKNPDTSATALMVAARHLLGPTFTAYEPETIWIELDPPEMNRDKLMAAIALDIMPSFYWDYRVYGNTALALNNEAVFVNHVPNAPPHYLAWANYEAELIFALTDDTSTQPEPSDDVIAYTAASLCAAGMVLCPKLLSFADEALERLLNKEAREFRVEVRTEWEKKDASDLSSASFDDNAVGVQLARLADVNLHILNRANALTKDLSDL